MLTKSMRGGEPALLVPAGTYCWYSSGRHGKAASRLWDSTRRDLADADDAVDNAEVERRRVAELRLDERCRSFESFASCCCEFAGSGSRASGWR